MKNLPGYELVEKGLSDIKEGKDTYYSALLYSAKSRLFNLNIILDDSYLSDHSSRMYSHLQNEFGDDAHSRLNSLQRRLISFLSCYEREKRLEAENEK